MGTNEKRESGVVGFVQNLWIKIWKAVEVVNGRILQVEFKVDEMMFVITNAYAPAAKEACSALLISWL